MSQYHLEEPLRLYRGTTLSTLRDVEGNSTEKVLTTAALRRESNEVISGKEEIILSMVKHIVKQRDCLESDVYYSKSHWLSFSEELETAKLHRDRKSSQNDQGVLAKLIITSGSYGYGLLQHSFLIPNGDQNNRLLVVNAHEVILAQKQFIIDKIGQKYYDICRSYSRESKEWLVSVLDANDCLNWEEGEIRPSEFWRLTLD